MEIIRYGIMVNKLPVSVIILSQNEEANIKYAIDSVYEYFDQIIVVDSFSIDKTVDIVSEYKGVELYQNKFINWAEQRNWALKNCNVRNKFVFFLDSDEYVTNEFINELRYIINNNSDKYSSIYVKPHLYFMGKYLKYSYGHPKVKRIFVNKNLQFICEGAREYAIVEEKDIYCMESPLHHYDRRPVSYWVEKHIRNAQMEADNYINNKCDYENVLSKTNWIRKKIWNRLPIFIRPFFYFIYRYFLKFGFLDGVIGFIYCFLHAFWYNFLIDVFIFEKLLKNKTQDGK